MKLKCFFIAFGLFCAVSPARPSYADFYCSTDVSYKWAPSPRSAPVPQGTAAPTASVTATPQEPSVVHFGSLERSALTEEAAKKVLEAEVARIKARASDECQREHEGFGSCVAGKMASKAGILASLDFNARKEVQRALTEECQAQLGKCLGVVSSDPTCREVVVATPTPAAAEKKDGKKK